jgi:hypothetical protein
MDFAAELIAFLAEAFAEIRWSDVRHVVGDVPRILSGKPVANRRRDRYVC